MAMVRRALTLLVLLALTTTVQATSDARAQVAKGGYIFAECHQAAPPSASASNASDAASSAFRADLQALLVDLPSATDPTAGFASLHSDTGGAFVRGLCFDDSPPSGGCAACLAAAAKKIADECGGSRRAGVWNAGCFVAYADTNASSPHEDAYRARDFSTDGDTRRRTFYNGRELATLAYLIRYRLRVACQN